MAFARLNLSADTRNTLHAAQTTIDVKAGALIVEEGDAPDTIFAIVTGDAAVERSGEDGVPLTLATLSEGELIGEMGFLDGAPRSASVRAVTDVRLTRLSASALSHSQAGRHALDALRAALGAAIVQRMRRNNDRYTSALEREVHALREREQFGIFYIYTVATLCIGTLANVIIARDLLDIDVYSQQFSWQYLAIYLIPLGIVIWRLKLPLSALGLTTKNLTRSLVEGLIMAAAAVGVMALARMGLDAAGAPRGTPFAFSPLEATAYTAHAFMQELLARGFLQSAYQRFLNDRRGYKAVLLSAILFGMFHLHFGLAAVVVTMVGGVLFGLIFLRHGNLAGVTLVHVVMGMAAFWFALL
ncbi:MAG: cyclic nucleotide-binding domain-containing protein [Pseudomonadota bacterium]